MMDEIKELTAENEEIAESDVETEEKVSRETISEENEERFDEEPAEETTENAADAAAKESDEAILWSAEYRLTEEEQVAFADNSGLFSSKKKTAVQGGLAAALCIINGISFATGGSKMALFLCILCAVLCGAVLIVPKVARKNVLASLKTAAETGDPTRLKSNGKTLFFGAQGEELAYGYNKTEIRVFDGIVTLMLSDGQMVCVPHRAVSEDAWAELCAHKTEKK